MKYLLKEMDDLVLSCLNPSSSGLPSPENSNDCFSVIKQQAEKFKFELSNNLSLRENETACKRIVQRHLNRLISLSDSLYRNMQQPLGDKGSLVRDKLAGYIQILNILESLQQYLLTEYPAYCNRRHPVSLYTQKKTIKYFRRKLSEFLEQKNRADNELVRIVLSPFRRLVRNKKPHLSFASRQYMFRLMKILLLHLSVSSEQKDRAKTLQENLYAINFNSIDFFNYCKKQVQDDIQNMDSQKDQIEKLYFHLKIVSQQPIDTSTCFNTKRTNAKDFISHWILEEICFLEKRMLLLARPGTDQQLVDQNFKIVTELSVAQVACFIRLLVESGVIKNKNRKELITFYAVYTQSKKQENISPESFRMRFYNIEESARLEIRSTIIQLLNHINRL